MEVLLRQVDVRGVAFDPMQKGTAPSNQFDRSQTHSHFMSVRLMKDLFRIVSRRPCKLSSSNVQYTERPIKLSENVLATHYFVGSQRRASAIFFAEGEGVAVLVRRQCCCRCSSRIEFCCFRDCWNLLLG